MKYDLPMIVECVEHLISIMLKDDKLNTYTRILQTQNEKYPRLHFFFFNNT